METYWRIYEGISQHVVPIKDVRKLIIARQEILSGRLRTISLSTIAKHLSP